MYHLQTAKPEKKLMPHVPALLSDSTKTVLGDQESTVVDNCIAVVMSFMKKISLL